MKEDPTRDPASEARDDHASEPRATPETDALAPSQGRIRTMREYIDELEAHARRLERQRDELMEALENIAKQKILDEVEDPVCCDFEDGYTTCVEVARAAIAAVKGGDQ
jgi:predicted transcriptional regulator